MAEDISLYEVYRLAGQTDREMGNDVPAITLEDLCLLYENAQAKELHAKYMEGFSNG